MTRTFPLAFLLSLSALASAPAAADSAEEAWVAGTCEQRPLKLTMYVTATGARMRDWPRADSAARATLPIASKLSTDCEVDGWLKVNTELEMDSRSGWVRRDLLSPERPTIATISRDLLKVDTAGRPAVAERLVALAPFEPRYHDTLIQALEVAGDDAGAERARAHRKEILAPVVERLPGEPRIIYVAKGGQLTPFATLGDNNTFGDVEELSTDDTGNLRWPMSLRKWRALNFHRQGKDVGMIQVLDRAWDPTGTMATYRLAPAGTGVAEGPDGIATNFSVGTPSGTPPVTISPIARARLNAAMRSWLSAEKVPLAWIDTQLGQAPSEETGWSGSLRNAISLGASAGQTLYVMTLLGNLDDSWDHCIDAVLLMQPNAAGQLKVVGKSLSRDRESDSGSHTFIDALDLDQDGSPELFFQRGLWEGSDYEIWQRRGEQWQAVHTGGYSGI